MLTARPFPSPQFFYKNKQIPYQEALKQFCEQWKIEREEFNQIFGYTGRTFFDLKSGHNNPRKPFLLYLAMLITDNKKPKLNTEYATVVEYYFEFNPVRCIHKGKSAAIGRSVAKIRENMALSPIAFAVFLGCNRDTIKCYENSIRKPIRTICALLNYMQYK